MRSRDRREALKRVLSWNPLWTLAVVFLVGGGVLCRPQINRIQAGAVCVEAAALCLLYGLVVCALKITHSWPSFREEKYSARTICIFLLISLFSTYFVFRKVANDHTVYTFDYRNYWDKTIWQSECYLWDPVVTLQNLYQSILMDDYNTFISAFMVLPLQALGNSYVAFALTIHVLFNLPTLWIISYAGQKLLARLKIRISWLLCYFVASFCPTLFFPSAYGYPDSLALIFVAILLLLSIDFDWAQPQWSHVIMMGAILPLCMITRRYFSFYIINFAVMLTICCLAFVIKFAREKKMMASLRCVQAYAIVGILSLSIFLIIFKPMFIKALENNYRVAYSAFSSGKLLEQFRRMVQRDGGFVYLIALVGMLIGIARKGTRIFSLSLATGTFASCLCFFWIQDMGYQHQLLVFPTLALFMIMFLGTIVCGTRWKIQRRVSAAAIAGLLLFNMGLGWSAAPASASVNGLFTRVRATSQQRGDLFELHNLASYVNELGGNVYLLACGDLLNNDTLQYSNYPYEANSVKNQYTTFDIDLRDGFPEVFFDSEIVIVPNPQQLRHGAENQRVIGALAQHFIDNTGFAVHYERLESFQLDGGITATVYRRFEDWTQEDYDALRAEFEGYYPDYPELFADRIHAPDVVESEPPA